MGKNLKTAVGLRLSDSEMRLLDKLAKRHGGKGAALVAGLKALDGQNEISREELIAEITRRLK